MTAMIFALSTGVALLILAGLAALGTVLAVGTYNALVRVRNEVKNAWAQIDVQLKRRHDLIPNLVETVKGYATHEKETLERVISARARAVDATNSGIEAQTKAEGELGAALGRLMMVVEQYPDLQANQNFLALQEELTSTENKIGFSRQFFNDQVMVYNTKVETFPTNMVAGMFNFKKEAFFEVKDQKQREAPAVSF